MKTILSLVVALVVMVGGSFAADPVASKAEFDKFGPKLYKMDEALKLSKETGKPVFCWMGKDLFENEAAREMSLLLGETTIQAAMDKDGTEYDKLGFRVKFSSNNYEGNSETYYILLKNFGPEAAKKALAISRGGK